MLYHFLMVLVKWYWLNGTLLFCTNTFCSSPIFVSFVLPVDSSAVVLSLHIFINNLFHNRVFRPGALRYIISLSNNKRKILGFIKEKRTSF